MARGAGGEGEGIGIDLSVVGSARTSPSCIASSWLRTATQHWSRQQLLPGTPSANSPHTLAGWPRCLPQVGGWVRLMPNLRRLSLSPYLEARHQKLTVTTALAELPRLEVRAGAFTLARSACCGCMRALALIVLADGQLDRAQPDFGVKW